MGDIASFDYNTPFTPSRSKKKRKNKPGLVPVTPQVALDRARQELTLGEWMEDCKSRSPAFRLCRGILTTELRLSGLVREGISSLFSHSTNPLRILCLGLGSPSSARDARSQLAFLLELCDDIRIDYSRVLAFDPIFTKEDEELLDAVKLQRSTENRACPRLS
ncbi:hypothetical protein NLI96_g241 [Meripilus lineatus]|uniref:SRR1-like domain-containing protein n=1 Tax=Meripilus lineatus TaxID=2056292 RepID=A0AAD5YIN0_9APHY|nr:hypothetical protein NLI96_g241 [Physisporinus lineatus]